MAQHDESYKLLFSHPQLVKDLLTGFVPEPWVQHVDFSTLEKVSGTFVADDLRDREDDVIWRVRWQGQWLYVYLLLEFQRTVDWFMGVRLVTYRGLLYQDLIRSGRLGPGDKLPPVVPIVLYNGKERWNAPLELSNLLADHPEGLERYRPPGSYLVLDEGALAGSDLAGVRNLAAAVFQLENSRSTEDLRAVLTRLVEWLAADEQDGLRRSFTVWIKRVLLPARLPGIDLPEVTNLQEVNAMLAERVMEWTEDWKNQGIEQGIEQGIKKGRKEGEVAMLLRQAERKYGALSDAHRLKIAEADADTLLRWSERILWAVTLDEVLAD